jgi:hypothetical protein
VIIFYRTAASFGFAGDEGRKRRCKGEGRYSSSCEERSDAAIQHLYAPGLLHSVRNDERGECRHKDGGPSRLCEERSNAAIQGHTGRWIASPGGFAMTKGEIDSVMTKGWNAIVKTEIRPVMSPSRYDERGECRRKDGGPSRHCEECSDEAIQVHRRWIASPGGFAMTGTG